MKRGLLAGVLAAVLMGCGDPDPYATLGVSNENVPPYAIKREGATVELVASTGQEGARKAIADYLNKNAGDDYLAVQVIRSPDAGAVVCRAEYVGSEDALPGNLQADSFPAYFLGAC